MKKNPYPGLFYSFYFYFFLRGTGRGREETGKGAGQGYRAKGEVGWTEEWEQ